MTEQIEYQLDRDITDEEIEMLENAFTSEFTIIYSAFLKSMVVILYLFRLDENLAPILRPFIDISCFQFYIG